MPKVIDIQADTVLLGMDDNSIREVKLSDCNFVPSIGDEVDIFENESVIIVSKAKQQTTVVTDSLVNTPQKRNSKESLTAIIFGTFFGHFGAHNFYLNNSASAKLQLVLIFTVLVIPTGLFISRTLAPITIFACMLGYIYLWLWVGVELSQIYQGTKKTGDESTFSAEIHKPFAILFIIIYWIACAAFIICLVNFLLPIIRETTNESYVGSPIYVAEKELATSRKLTQDEKNAIRFVMNLKCTGISEVTYGRLYQEVLRNREWKVSNSNDGSTYTVTVKGLWQDNNIITLELHHQVVDGIVTLPVEVGINGKTPTAGQLEAVERAFVRAQLDISEQIISDQIEELYTEYVRELMRTTR